MILSLIDMKGEESISAEFAILASWRDWRRAVAAVGGGCRRGKWLGGYGGRRRGLRGVRAGYGRINVGRRWGLGGELRWGCCEGGRRAGLFAVRGLRM